MESIDLEMGDLFAQEADDVGAHALHPDLDGDENGPMRAEEEQNGQDDEEGVVANLQRLSKGAAKKRVAQPQPKLDVERLKSERGLAILPKIFEDVKFKGKGYEAQDLKLVMTKLEHWAHRLYPVATFDQFIERMEKLGAKKPVQTCLKRVRLDMPLLDNDFVAQYNEPEASPESKEPVDEEMEEVDAETAFEEMLRLEKEKLIASEGDTDELNSQTGLSAERANTSREEPLNGDVIMTPSKTSLMTPTAPENDKNKEKEMTPDIKERIEANKRKALEKRATKLGVPVESLLPSNKNVEACRTEQSAGSLKQTKSDITSEKAEMSNQSPPSRHLDSQLEVGREPASQLCLSLKTSSQSQTDLFKSLDAQSNVDSLSGSEQDMQTEDVQINILKGDTGVQDGPNVAHSNKVMDVLAEKDGTSERTGTKQLNLDPESISSVNGSSDPDISLTCDSSVDDGSSLHLDMSVSETENTDDNHLNLQLELSVCENTQKGLDEHVEVSGNENY